MATDLKHFGILGMRWGHRKSQTSGGGQGGSSKPAAIDDSSDDHKRVSALKRKKPSQLTNAEMQAVISRLELEQKFATLNKKQVNAGQKFVTDLLVTAGKQEAQKFVNANAADLTKKLIGMMK